MGAEATWPCSTNYLFLNEPSLIKANFVTKTYVSIGRNDQITGNLLPNVKI